MHKLTPATCLLAATLAVAAQPPASPDLLEKGKAVFSINCVPCHGATGAGDGVAAAALNPKPRNFTVDAFKNGDKPENVFKTVSEGIKGTTMVAFAQLSETERWALAYYVIQLRAAGKPAATAAAAPGKKDGAKK